MNYDDYNIAQKIAENNARMIKKGIPHSFLKREEALVDNFKLKETPLEKLEELYIFMNELYAFVGQYTPCRKGCNRCCYMEVAVSDVEAEYITKFTGIRQTPYMSEFEYLGTPCPFLEESGCSIYEHRPFVCRRHVALFDDSKWCRIDLADKYKFTQMRFSGIEDAYKYIVNTSRSTIIDIRQLFHVGP